MFILLSIFTNAAILVSSSAPGYAYSPCNCVSFVMDDVNDSTFSKVQLATMDYFISQDLPFTASIIVSLFANSSDLNVYHKVQEGFDEGLFDIPYMVTVM